MAAERRREHWSGVARAVTAVDRSAAAYVRAMASSADRAGAQPSRERAVIAAAVRYQESCGRLAAALGSGPEPVRAAPWLAILLDGAHPEVVVASGAARHVLAELSALQAELDAGARTARRRRAADRAAGRLARARSRRRLGHLGRIAPRP